MSRPSGEPPENGSPPTGIRPHLRYSGSMANASTSLSYPPLASYGLATLAFDPERFTGRFRARDGQEVRVRLIRPEDWPLLVDLFHHLSPEARWRRFHTAIEDPDPAFVEEMARRLAQVDNQGQGGAVLALVPRGSAEILVGVGRLGRPPEALDSPEAEVAIVVRDDWQGQGVGTVLAALLIPLARRMGVQELWALTQADNAPLFQVIQGLESALEMHTSAGETEIRVRVDRFPQAFP